MGKLLAGTVLFAAFFAIAHAQSQQELLRDGTGSNTDNVLTYGMGYHQQRYSPLRQINKSTVKRLVDRKSTRLNSSHGYISYAVFCLKKKKNHTQLCLLQ